MRQTVAPRSGFDVNYTLSEDQVHVWRTTLEMAASGFAKMRQILSADEPERTDRFHFEVDRRCTVIGCGYLRLLLGQVLHLPANKQRFE